MGSKMLIDATHAEETRVVVLNGTRIDEFDFESASRKQLKGNIYLAKVTRVEPSLQAAFVDYGGNRHGFLAFSEIHPDYYQIPVADRQALIREQEEDARREDDEAAEVESAAEAEAQSQGASGKRRSRQKDRDRDSEPESEAREAQAESEGAPESNGSRLEFAPHPEHGLPAEGGNGVETIEEDAESVKVESVGAEDALEEVPRRPRRTPRRVYKIQEVIKRRQVILVQVVKEERGNKGAALTTYLSLAGRYCVLMPNTARGGGISRKITDANDRRRLKEVARDIEVPQGMGLIVRTAGAQRTKTEIKRDYDYLLRLWENVRDLTLKSIAPSLVYEEGSLIKRAIRDLYTKDVDEVQVEGDDGYREAKDFMKMLMPSHARNVKLYKDTRPLFSRFPVESQLDSLFSPTVTLPSGGYMVLNQTEALVSIDINSGKSTREHNIEDTALRTNLEASDEIARQLRLRDLAGLIVIDFIDMDEKRNNRSVERRLKDALKNDRARIQVGRISHFGLLEMSRQRLRPSLLEGSTKVCPHCEGKGIVRSVSSCALSVLRSIEDHLMNRKAENLTVHCGREVATYILNEKRDNLLAIETAYGNSIFIMADDNVKGSQAQIERGGERAVPLRRPQPAVVKIDSAHKSDEESEAAAAEPEVAVEAEEIEEDDVSLETPAQSEERPQRRRRGRRGGRRGDEERTGRRPEQRQRERELPGLGEQPAVMELQGEEAPGEREEAAGEEPARAPQQREGGRRGGRDRWRQRRPREDGNGHAPPEGEAPHQQPDYAGPAEPAPPQPTVEIQPAAPPPRVETPQEPAASEAEAPRKWQPPAPTIAPPGQAKGGWWSKRA